MVRILDMAAVEPCRTFNLSRSFTILRSPRKVRLAAIHIRIPVNSRPNRVELVATVGVRGITNIAKILFSWSDFFQRIRRQNKIVNTVTLVRELRT